MSVVFISDCLNKSNAFLLIKSEEKVKRTNIILWFILLSMLSLTALAQDPRDTAQAKLTQALQGKRVSLKMDMPATEKGVVVAADKADVIDREKYQKRLKTYGTAIQNGEATVITGVKLSGNEIVVEFAGGGAPEGDLGAAAGPRPAPTASSTRESRARSRMNANGDPNQNLLDDQNVRSTVKYESAKRQQADSKAEAEYQARRAKAVEEARALNLKMGSRFIIKFDNRDAGAVTREELTKLLSAFVSF